MTITRAFIHRDRVGVRFGIGLRLNSELGSGLSIVLIKGSSSLFHVGT